MIPYYERFLAHTQNSLGLQTLSWQCSRYRGFRATTRHLMARDLATALSRGDSPFIRSRRKGPAECGIQQKLSVLIISNPILTKGATYSSSDGMLHSFLLFQPDRFFHSLRKCLKRRFILITTHTPSRTS